MLRSVTTENDWLTALQHAPWWQPPPKPTFIIAPHPDDETLGAGGLIALQCARGVPVVVVAVTDGEAAYPDIENLGPLRCLEQQEALCDLGLHTSGIVRLRLPDSGVAHHESELIDALSLLIPGDSLLVAPWRSDPHPDHEACGRAAEKIAQQNGAALLSYFFWTWHHSEVDSLSGLPLVRLALDGELQTARAKALSCHRSQLAHHTGSPVLPESLLAPARRSFETFIAHG